MKVRGLCIAVLALIGLSLGLSAPDVRGAEDLPVWTPGDFWSYTAPSFSPFPGTTGSGGIRFDVVAREVVDVGGSQVPAYRAAVTSNATVMSDSGWIPVTYRYNEWFRVSDLASVRVFRTVPGGVNDTVNVTVTWGPPLEMLWPLVPDAAWSRTSTVSTLTVVGTTVLESGTYTVTKNSTVGMPETISVTAGTFDAMPVSESLLGATGYDRVFWSAAVGNVVAVRHSSPGVGEQQTVQLASYLHQATGSAVPDPSAPLPLLWVGLASAGAAGIALLVWVRSRRREIARDTKAPEPSRLLGVCSARGRRRRGR